MLSPNDAGIIIRFRAISARHLGVSTSLVVITLIILGNAIVRNSVARAAAYLGVIAVSVVLIEICLARISAKGKPPPVHDPSLESTAIAVSILGAFAWLVPRFVFGYMPPPGVGRLIWLILLLLFVFDIGLAVFFFARRYRPYDLGVRATGLAPVPFIVAVFAFVAIVVFPGHVTWTEIVRESGSPIGVVGIAISAALPEEFLRFSLQTRGAAVFNNRAVAWLLASMVWAALHGPKLWGESHSLLGTGIAVLNIAPLGLLWGYLTFRTKTFLPAMFVHGSNVWGLQNLP